MSWFVKRVGEAATFWHRLAGDQDSIHVACSLTTAVAVTVDDAGVAVTFHATAVMCSLRLKVCAVITARPD